MHRENNRRKARLWLKRFSLGVVGLVVLAGVALGGDAILRTFETSATRCSSLMTNDQSLHECDAHSSNAVIVYLPGVIARAEDSAEPLLETWRQFGDVQFVDYLGGRFDPQIAADGVSEILKNDLAGYDTVNVFAESMGCFLVAQALNRLDMSFSDAGRVNIILGDCPSGSDSTNPLSALTTVFYPGPIYNAIADGVIGLGHFIDDGMGKYPGNPQWSWSSSYTEASKIQPGLDPHVVQLQQISSSTGFPLSAFTDEVRYIREGIPSLAGMSGIHLTYIASQSSADSVVKQPTAALDWQERAANYALDLHVLQLDFPSDHCDYMAWPAGWNGIFEDLLGSRQ